MRRIRWPEHPRVSWVTGFMAAGVLASVGVGVLVAAESVYRPMLLIALAGVIPFPVAVRCMQGKWDPLEPIFILSAGLLVLYVLSPLALVKYEQTTFRGFSTEPGFDLALAVALVGTLALYGGYCLPAGRRWARRLRPLPGRWRANRLLPLPVGLLAVSGLLTVLFGIQAGGGAALIEYTSGRTSPGNSPAQDVSAYLKLAPLLSIPAGLIFLEAHRQLRSRLALPAAVCCFGLAVAYAAPRGDRIWLLAALLPVFAFLYLRAERRPRIMLLVFLLGVGVLAANVLREYRVKEERTQSALALTTEALRHVDQQFETFILGPDASAFQAMSLLPSTEPPPYPLLTIMSVMAGPVPGFLWPGKPQAPELYAYRSLFPRQAAQTDAGTSLSLFGGFYYDAGWPGVVTFALFIGLAWRTLFEYLHAHPHNPGVRMFYAAALPYTLILLRGNPADSLGRAVFTVFPIIVFAFIAGGLGMRREERSAQRWPGSVAGAPP